jgi:hypothetical protein
MLKESEYTVLEMRNLKALSSTGLFCALITAELLITN